MRKFNIGDRVRIVNVTNEDGPILNGCTGTVKNNDFMFIGVEIDEEFLTEAYLAVITSKIALLVDDEIEHI